ncbi:hypothetical protein CRW69_13220 [Salmonella enterica subsp. enterica serovar Newport]|nr:hypothetical protein [Salmonella enterica subsp. enterica serovar Newport]
MDKTDVSRKNHKQFIAMPGINRFSERLAIAMEGLSNVALASSCGLSESAIRSYLKGRSYPGIDKIEAIAKACNVPMSWLITGEAIATIDDGVAVFDDSRVTALITLLGEEQRQNLVWAVVEYGVSGIMEALKKQYDQPEREYTREEQEAMLRALPISEKVKNTASLALALGDDANQEILEILDDVKRRFSPEGGATSTPDPSLKQKAG